MRLRVLLVITALTAATASCTGAPRTTPSGTQPAADLLGGTLRVGVPAFGVLGTGPALDPQVDYSYDSWEVFRCCLLRTLLGYVGRPTSEGGTILRPDLATSLPSVSTDGLTWTFHIRPGIHYAPPLQGTEITSQDFVRALEREGKQEQGGYRYYYGSIIQGFHDYATGAASSIAGLQTPDTHTLRIILVHPAGDLPELFALPATAPLPPNPSAPTDRLGVAAGHDSDYGRFVVASGPYMVRGANLIDFSRPATDQQPAAGYTPGTSLTLVRNPSWHRSSDPLRPAYADRIQMSLGNTIEDISARIDQGTLDLLLYSGPAPQAPAPQVQAYERDPSLGTVIVNPRDALRFIPMNLAQPPFDDIHVRKAVNLAVNRAELVRLLGGHGSEVIGHLVVDSLEGNLLLNYDPYRTSGDAGSAELAGKEMTLSAYDANHDGLCDASACRDVTALVFANGAFPDAAKLVQADLRTIGIDLRIRTLDSDAVFATFDNPRTHSAMAIGPAWVKDIPNASNYIAPLFGSQSLEGGNDTLVGATGDQLRSWGYQTASVPSVDDRISACDVQLGAAQLRCWAALDQYMMQNVVPWVPYLSESHVQVVPRRILHYSYDQFTDLPALDQIALRSPQ